jgi:hypothetical protein
VRSGAVVKRGLEDAKTKPVLYGGSRAMLIQDFNIHKGRLEASIC